MSDKCIFIAAPVGKFPSTYHFLPLSQELARRGHKVVLLVAHRRVEMADPTGNPAIYVWPSDRPTRWRDALFLFRLLRRYKPDCVVGNFAAVNLMMLLGWLTGTAHRVAWYHTMTAAIDLDNRLPAWRVKLLRWRKRFVYRVCTHIVPASQAAVADVQRVYGVPPNKVHVFRNSLADPLRTDALPALPPQPRVICVGRLYPTKGQDVLIRAIALLKDKHPGVVFEFVGDGPAQVTFATLARETGVADRCVFVGDVSHREVLERLGKAAVSVMPSRSDNCPLAVIEALAMGVPVIGSNVGGIPELIREGIDGFLVPPDDAAALATVLGRVLADPVGLRRLRDNAREGFLTRFEQQPALRAQAEWLESLLGCATVSVKELKTKRVVEALNVAAVRPLAELVRK